MLNRSQLQALALTLLLASAIMPGAALAQAPKPAAKTPAPRPTPARTPAALKPGQTPAPGQPPRPGVPGQPGAPGAPGTPGAKPAAAGGKAGDTALESVVAPLPNPALEGSNLPEPPSEEPPEDLEENAGEAEKINILKKGRPIEEVFQDIKKKTGVMVIAKGDVASQAVDIQAKEKTVREILDLLVGGKEWTWIRRQDGTYEVWDKAGYVEKEMKKRVIRKVFQLKFVPVTDVVTAIEGVKSEVGELAANPRTNEIIVTDLPDKVAQIESILKEIDTQLYTRRFGIRFAKFEDLQSRIEGLLSPAGELQADAQNRILIVTDTFYKIKQMEQLIEMLDIDRPMKIYHLVDILGSEDGGGAEDMIDKFIKPIASEDALIEFNHSQGTLLVKDVAEVHDQILEILKALDQTPKQVWIEGEILEVSKNFSFEFGTEWTFSRDLPHAITRGLTDSFLPVTGGTPVPTTTATTTPTPSGNVQTARNELAVLADEVYPLVTGGAAGLKVINLAGNLKAQMTAMMQDDQTRLLLQPRVLARNGQDVEFNLTQQNPQQTTFFNTGNFNNNNNVNSNFGGTSITFVETGVILNLTPTISNRGLIEMDLEFTNSTPFNAQFVTNGQLNTAIGVNEQSVQTTLIIPSGETRAIGGLVSHSNSDGKGGIPWLSKLPYVGFLFGKKSEKQDQRNLIFFVTPTVVEEKPQIDVVELPVNAAARALDAVAENGLARPANLNPLPEELKPLLRQAPPGQEGLLFGPEDQPTTDTFELLPLGEEGYVPKAKKPKRAKKEKKAAEELIQEEGMLQDEAPPAVEDESPMAEEDAITGPGAELSAGQGASGPSGTIGEGGKASAAGVPPGGAAKPGAKPAPTPKPAQAAGRPSGRPGTTGAAGGASQPPQTTGQPTQAINPQQGLQGALGSGSGLTGQPPTETQFR